MHQLLHRTGLHTIARFWSWLMEPMVFTDRLGNAQLAGATVRLSVAPATPNATGRSAVPASAIPAMPVRRWSPPAPRHAAGAMTRHHALALSA